MLCSGNLGAGAVVLKFIVHVQHIEVYVPLRATVGRYVCVCARLCVHACVCVCVWLCVRVRV